jgi:hypothetical protein
VEPASSFYREKVNLEFDFATSVSSFKKLSGLKYHLISRTSVRNNSRQPVKGVVAKTIKGGKKTAPIGQPMGHLFTKYRTKGSRTRAVIVGQCKPTLIGSH